MTPNRLCHAAIFIVAMLGLLAGCTGSEYKPKPLQTEYTLSINVSPPEGGVVSPLSGSKYNPGISVPLTVYPAEFYLFSNWEGPNKDEVATDTNSIVMDSDKSLTAVFYKMEYALNITVVGQGEVVQELITRKSIYQNGDQVRLTAIPATGYIFDGWAGDLGNDQNPSIVTINSAKDITAIFTISP